MRAPRPIPLLTFLSAVLAAQPIHAEAPLQQEGHERMLLAARVFYLQGIDLREAMMTLRHSLDIRKVVMVKDREALVLSDLADRLDKAETLLRERKAVIRVAEPSAPMFTEEFGHDASATRVFDVEAGRTRDVATVLRTIYDARHVQWDDQLNRVTLQAAQPILDSSEALLRELGLLAPVTGAGK